MMRGMTSDQRVVDLMVIVPHPDDEVFGAGGVLTHYSEQGKHTAVLTLTRGDAGRTLGICEPHELGDYREAELRASLDILGVAEQHILQFPDGKLKDVPADEVVTEIVSRLEHLTPRTIITFAPNGSNGHLDHVITHHRVIAALEQSRHKVDRLYYYASETVYAGEQRPLVEGNRPNFLSFEEIERLHLPPTHYLDMSAYMENKLRAMGQYDTQARSVLMFLRRLPRRIAWETFHRAAPEHSGVGPVTVRWL